MEPRPFPVRKTDNLRRGRITAAGARYFVTIVTERRKPWLVVPTVGAAMLTVLRVWQKENRGLVLAATVMPDHVHILFELSDTLTVGQTVARWKTAMRKVVGYAESFQRDFWEHRLRKKEEVEDYALYVFLNPYRARLLPVDSTWAAWWAPVPRMFKFTAALDASGAPPREWIEWPAERFAGLAHGE
jgi:REP element-mobilizing transposase RayT